jgi:hypothetical protein
MSPFAWRWVLIGGAYAIVLGAVALFFHQGDWNYFAHIGPRFLDDDPQVRMGYDGQFAYFIAMRGLNAVPDLDVPAYRLQRILYPLLAWLMALGHVEWVSATLVLVNVLALMLGMGAFAELLHRETAPAWAPLVFVAWFGIAQVLLYDLNELVALAFGLWGWLFLARRQTTPAGVAFGAGALGKDLAFLFAAPAIVRALVRGEWRTALTLAAWTFAPYLVWMGILRIALGAWSFEARAAGFEKIPFGGLAGADTLIPFVIGFLILPGAACALYALRYLDHVYALSVVASFLFLVFLPTYSYAGHAVFRLTSPLVLASMLLLARQQRVRPMLFLVALWSSSAMLSFLVAIGG